MPGKTQIIQMALGLTPLLAWNIRDTLNPANCKCGENPGNIWLWNVSSHFHFSFVGERNTFVFVCISFCAEDFF